MKNRPIEDLNLTGRAFNALKRAGVNDTDTLLELKDHELMQVLGIGSKLFAHIVQTLKKIVEREASGEIS